MSKQLLSLPKPCLSCPGVCMASIFQRALLCLPSWLPGLHWDREKEQQLVQEESQSIALALLIRQ